MLLSLNRKSIVLFSINSIIVCKMHKNIEMKTGELNRLQSFSDWFLLFVWVESVCICNTHTHEQTNKQTNKKSNRRECFMYDDGFVYAGHITPTWILYTMWSFKSIIHKTHVSTWMIVCPVQSICVKLRTLSALFSMQLVRSCKF